jgi:hypothetical protein
MSGGALIKEEEIKIFGYDQTKLPPRRIFSESASEIIKMITFVRISIHANKFNQRDAKLASAETAESS